MTDGSEDWKCEFWNVWKLRLSLPTEEHIEAFIRDAEEAIESAEDRCGERGSGLSQ